MRGLLVLSIVASLASGVWAQSKEQTPLSATNVVQRLDQAKRAYKALPGGSAEFRAAREDYIRMVKDGLKLSYDATTASLRSKHEVIDRYCQLTAHGSASQAEAMASQLTDAEILTRGERTGYRARLQMWRGMARLKIGETDAGIADLEAVLSLSGNYEKLEWAKLRAHEYLALRSNLDKASRVDHFADYIVLSAAKNEKVQYNRIKNLISRANLSESQREQLSAAFWEASLSPGLSDAAYVRYQKISAALSK